MTHLFNHLYNSSTFNAIFTTLYGLVYIVAALSIGILLLAVIFWLVLLVYWTCYEIIRWAFSKLEALWKSIRSRHYRTT